MDGQEWILVAGIAILLVITCAYYSKSKKRIRKMLFGSLSGIAVLYPVQLAMSSFGYGISMNLFTVAVSAVLGIPGVVLLAASQFLY